MAKQWVWVAVGAVAVGETAARCGDTEGTASAPSPTPTPTPSVVSTPPVTPKPWYEDYDPARYLSPETVAKVVADAVNTPRDAHVQEIIVRPR